MKIGLFADSHYCSKDFLVGTRRPFLSTQKLQNAVQEFQKQNVELIICLGDLIDSDDSSEKEEKNLKLISSILIDSGIESYCCMGNHDAFLFNKTEFFRISGLTLAPAIIKKADKLLILLDANFDKDGSEYEKGNIDWKDTIVSKQQIEILKKTLKKSKEKYVYVFIHQNLDPTFPAEYIIQNAAEIREIFKDCGKIRAVYQGHYHFGASNCHDGISYITLKAMCEGDENAFEIIEI